MRLADTQRAFQAQVLSEELALPSGWDEHMAPGIAIYRNAYRARLIAALEETFPKTLAWVGEEPFARAAAHHLIINPPSSWTLDDAGAGFPQTLGELFARDPEVNELAWLEWVMHQAFAAADRASLDPAGFAAATEGFAEADWAGMRLLFSPSLTVGEVRTDCVAIWQSLSGEGQSPASVTLAEPAAIAVWREGFISVFRQISLREAHCLDLAREGASFGDLCEYLAKCGPEDEAAAQAGQMLARWLGDALVVGLSR
ncbi:MAG TPA: DNA-binding domain-containing protein [Sphingomonadaceae bacterium]|nr:DNA-binding domain-containing protein [Sphingomonadaceae bacterium]